jgi:Cytochrome bd terminal oxidase subunit I
VLKTLGLRRNDETFHQAARFWALIFGVNFGINFVMGVVTGIPMEFQFGTALVTLLPSKRKAVIHSLGRAAPGVMRRSGRFNSSVAMRSLRSSSGRMDRIHLPQRNPGKSAYSFRIVLNRGRSRLGSCKPASAAALRG